MVIDTLAPVVVTVLLLAKASRLSSGEYTQGVEQLSKVG